MTTSDRSDVDLPSSPLTAVDPEFERMARVAALAALDLALETYRPGDLHH